MSARDKSFGEADPAAPADASPDQPQTIAFANAQSITMIRQPDQCRQYLILVRSGSKRRPSFFSEPLPENRTFDLAVNYYATPHPDDLMFSNADILFTGGLSKMHGAKQLFEHTGVHLKYDGVMFLDDDIEILFDPNDFFAVCQEYDLALAQAALTPDCRGGVGLTFQHPGLKLRTTNWVEVMAPFFRRDFLVEMLHSFDMSISGWGLDLYWGHHLGDGRNAGIIDQYLMRHTVPMDLADGPFYKYLKSLGVEPKEEMREVLASIGLKNYQAKPLSFVYHTYKFGF